MYEFLLVAHVLAAFALMANVVMLSGFVLGVPVGRGSGLFAFALSTFGAVGTLVFGVWLAIYVDGYGILDGWIVAALVLWLAAAAVQPVVTRAFGGGPRGTPEGGEDLRRAALANWAHTAAVLALLVVMIYKPGA